jgi:hypothetical protein
MGLVQAQVPLARALSLVLVYRISPVLLVLAMAALYWQRSGLGWRQRAAPASALPSLAV